MAEYVSARWLGEFLELPPRAIHELARGGKFRAYRLGHKTVRFKLSEVLVALDEAATR